MKLYRIVKGGADFLTPSSPVAIGDVIIDEHGETHDFTREMCKDVRNFLFKGYYGTCCVKDMSRYLDADIIGIIRDE